jgi:hypothetical protein
VVDPELIMTLGKVPTDVLMPHHDVTVTKDAGEIVEMEPPDFDELTFMVNMHPAATIYGADRRETFDAAVKKAVEYVIDPIDLQVEHDDFEQVVHALESSGFEVVSVPGDGNYEIH